MENILKKVFVISCTLVVLLIVYSVCDALLSGILYLVIQLWSKTLAVNVFKYSFAGLLLIQTVFTIPAVWKSVNDDK